jgi:putative MATE family efflux protein
MNSDQLINKRMILFSLTWPIFIETFLRMLFGSVDTFMLSGYSDNAVAGVGAANQYVSILVLLFQVTAAGSGIIISQYLGARNFKKASDVAVVSLVFNLFFGLLISLILFVFSGAFLRIMNFEKDIFDYSKEFLTILGTFSFVQALSCTIAAILRSHGYVKWPMIVNMGANILNVIGNCIFIYGLFGLPVLGVKGVAISTVFSQFVGLVAIFIIFIKKVELNLSLKQVITMPKETVLEVFKDIWRIGGPSAGENLSYNVSQIVITAFISTMGANALTARFYSFNLMLYIMLFGVAIGQGTQILVGHLIGANKMEDAYKTCLRSLKISIVIAFIMALIFAVFSMPLLDLFTDKKEIISMGSMLLIIAIVLEPGRAFNIVLGNSLKGAGDAKYIFVLGLSSMWGIAVLFSYILGIQWGLGLVGVWIAFACDEWIRGIGMLMRWRSRVWEKMSVVQKSDEAGTEESWLQSSHQSI